MAAANPVLARMADAGAIDWATAPMPGRHHPTPTDVGQASVGVAFNGRDKAERNDMLPVTTSAVAAASGGSVRQQRLLPFLDELPDATFFSHGERFWAEFLRRAEGIGAVMETHSDIRAVISGIQREAEAAGDRDQSAA